MKSTTLSFEMLATAGALIACTPSHNEQADGRITQAATVANGMSMNGISMNGISMNGISMNGMSMNGISMNGISMNGSTLTGVTADGTAVSGEDFIGATMVGLLPDGSILPLRIDDMRNQAAPNQDVLLYTVAYAAVDGWRPLCGVDGTGAAQPAIAVAGAWDLRQGVPGGGDRLDEPEVFTLSCTHGAIAKCVELGYKPWAGLAAHHQACTRMLRADYCGDGSSYTVDGTPLNVYDGVGVQGDTEKWSFEAEWDEDGAACLVEQRVESAGVPPCRASLEWKKCGKSHKQHFADGTLLMSEYKEN